MSFPKIDGFSRRICSPFAALGFPPRLTAAAAVRILTAYTFGLAATKIKNEES
jgi:hypothetical protein